MRYIKIVLLVLIFFFFAIFIIQNNELLGQNISFRLDLFVIPPLESIPLPLYFVVLITLLLGALVCVLFLAGDRIKMSFVLRRANKRINLLEHEVASLRALPLTENAYRAPEQTEQKPAASSSAIAAPQAEIAALPESSTAQSEKSDEEKSDSVEKL